MGELSPKGSQKFSSAFKSVKFLGRGHETRLPKRDSLGTSPDDEAEQTEKIPRTGESSKDSRLPSQDTTLSAGNQKHQKGCQDDGYASSSSKNDKKKKRKSYSNLISLSGKFGPKQKGAPEAASEKQIALAKQQLLQKFGTGHSLGLDGPQKSLKESGSSNSSKMVRSRSTPSGYERNPFSAKTLSVKLPKGASMRQKSTRGGSSGRSACVSPIRSGSPRTMSPQTSQNLGKQVKLYGVTSGTRSCSGPLRDSTSQYRAPAKSRTAQSDFHRHGLSLTAYADWTSSPPSSAFSNVVNRGIASTPSIFSNGPPAPPLLQSVGAYSQSSSANDLVPLGSLSAAKSTPLLMMSEEEIQKHLDSTSHCLELSQAILKDSEKKQAQLDAMITELCKKRSLVSNEGQTIIGKPSEGVTHRDEHAEEQEEDDGSQLASQATSMAPTPRTGSSHSEILHQPRSAAIQQQARSQESPRKSSAPDATVQQPSLRGSAQLKHQRRESHEALIRRPSRFQPGSILAQSAQNIPKGAEPEEQALDAVPAHELDRKVSSQERRVPESLEAATKQGVQPDSPNSSQVLLKRLHGGNAAADDVQEPPIPPLTVESRSHSPVGDDERASYDVLADQSMLTMPPLVHQPAHLAGQQHQPQHSQQAQQHHQQQQQSQLSQHHHQLSKMGGLKVDNPPLDTVFNKPAEVASAKAPVWEGGPEKHRKMSSLKKMKLWLAPKSKKRT